MRKLHENDAINDSLLPCGPVADFGIFLLLNSSTHTPATTTKVREQDAENGFGAFDIRARSPKYAAQTVIVQWLSGPMTSGA